MDSGSKKTQARIAAGPGKLCRIMQIDRSLNGGILQPGEPLARASPVAISTAA